MKLKIYYRLISIILWVLGLVWWGVWFCMIFMMELPSDQILEPAYAATLGTLCWVTGTLFSRMASERS